MTELRYTVALNFSDQPIFARKIYILQCNINPKYLHENTISSNIRKQRFKFGFLFNRNLPSHINFHCHFLESASFSRFNCIEIFLVPGLYANVANSIPPYIKKSKYRQPRYDYGQSNWMQNTILLVIFLKKNLLSLIYRVQKRDSSWKLGLRGCASKIQLCSKINKVEVEFLNSSISAHWRLFILHLDWIEIIFLFGNQNMLLNQSATGVFLTYKNIIGGSFINLGIGLLCFVIKWCFTWDPHRFRLYGWSRKNISLKQRSKILLFPIKLKSKNSKK